MRLFITGATGLIGRRLVWDRLARGDEVVALSRDAQRAARLFGAKLSLGIVQGNPVEAGEWQKRVAGCDAVIHLAAAGIADRRWTKPYKAILVASRIASTRQVVAAIKQADEHQRPRTFINGSAVGYYGDQGDRELDENAPAGDDFLAQLTLQWEQQALEARALGVRIVLLRTAVVLDDRGGALKKMARPFQFFVGGALGSGRQFFPWIHWRDLMGLMDLALRDPEIEGALNAVAPQATRNRDFAKALGRALHRPAWLPAPRLGLRIALGEVANSLMASQRVIPATARRLGYQFHYPDIESALGSLFGSDAVRR